MKKAVFIGSQHYTDCVYAGETIEKLKKQADFPYGTRTFSKEEILAGDFRDVSYLFSSWEIPVLTEEEIAEAFPSVECVFYAAGSVQHFARPYFSRGVRVFSAFRANGIPVADVTVSEIILASKGFFSRLHIPGSGGVLDETWKITFPGNFPGDYDIKIGIIGAGYIGKLVIRKLKQMLEHIEILVFDPFLPEETAKELGVKRTDLATLFSECDVISNHLADNEATRGMMGRSCFEKMKSTAVFINTGRGAQIIEADLIAAMKESPYRAAVLDVTFPEPPVTGSELYNLKNVFLTPHIAGSLGQEIHRMGEYMYEDLCKVQENRTSANEVSSAMLQTMA